MADRAWRPWLLVAAFSLVFFLITASTYSSLGVVLPAMVRDERVSVAVCPRSNALFARQPDIGAMERVGLSVLLGTDNAMFHAPSIWREMEFAYVASRLRKRPVSAAFLARAALVEPWNWLGEPESALVVADMPVAPVVLRLPPEDPAYQVVTRATEHLMVRTRPGASRRRGGR